MLEKKSKFQPIYEGLGFKALSYCLLQADPGMSCWHEESLPLQYHTWLVPYHPTILLNSTSVIVICLYIFPSDVSIWKAVILSSSLIQHVFWMPTICRHWFRNWKVGHKWYWQKWEGITWALNVIQSGSSLTHSCSLCLSMKPKKILLRRIKDFSPSLWNKTKKTFWTQTQQLQTTHHSQESFFRLSLHWSNHSTLRHLENTKLMNPWFHKGAPRHRVHGKETYTTKWLRIFKLVIFLYMQIQQFTQFAYKKF